MGSSAQKPIIEIPVNVHCIQSNPEYSEGCGRYSIKEDLAVSDLNKLIARLVGHPTKSFINSQDVTNSSLPISYFWPNKHSMVTVWFEVLSDSDDDCIDLGAEGHLKFLIEKHSGSSLPDLPNNRVKIFESVTGRQLSLILRRILKLENN